MSSAETLKLKANVLFDEGTSADLERPVRLGRFQAAIQLYHQASLICERNNNSNSNNDLVLQSSCKKNLFFANVRSAGLLIEDQPLSVESADRVVDFIRAACKALLEAMMLGEHHQKPEWQTSLDLCSGKHLRQVLESLIQSHETNKKLDLYVPLRNVCTVFGSPRMSHANASSTQPPSSQAAFEAHFAFAQFLLDQTIAVRRKGVRINELTLVQRITKVDAAIVELNKAIGFMQSLASQPPLHDMHDMHERSKQLETRLRDRKVMHATQKQLKLADEMYADIISTASEDQITQLIDIYKQAIVEAREIYLQGEAEGSSRLGRLFDKILQDKERATAYHNHTLSLAVTLVGQVNVNLFDWYNESSEYITAKQAEDQRAEELAKEQKTHAARAAAAPLIEALRNEEKKSWTQFLDFVYKTHPPRNTPTPQQDTTASPKKRILRAIAAYHPDKNTTQNDVQWRVICGEISKILGKFYGVVKNDES